MNQGNEKKTVAQAVDKGGPAFPVLTQYEAGDEVGAQVGNTTGWNMGMALRDYFAAKALIGGITYSGMEGNDPKFFASMAYEYADAMIAARKAVQS